MAGITFNGTTSSSLHITSAVPRVPLLPERIPSKIEIAGRDGSVDFGNDSYRTRLIPVDCYISAVDEATLTGYMADIAVWLSGEGWLLFDADATKQWYAKVYSGIDMEFIPLLRQFTIVFEAQPYAVAVTETTGAAIDVEDDYESDVIFYPTINVTLVDASTSLRVTLSSTGEYVLIEDTLEVDDEIVINMATGKVTKNDSSIMDKVNIASAFFGVPTGNQTITVTADGDYTATMDYYKRYSYA